MSMRLPGSSMRSEWIRVAHDRQNAWYRTAFDGLYPLLYPNRNDAQAEAEACALLDLLRLPRGAQVLDLACGTARHCQAIAQRGISPWGLDLSPALLSLARKRDCLAGRLVRADMRLLPFRRSFDAVLSLFTRFGYFSKEEEHSRVLREVARVIKPGGLLLLDHIHRPALERTWVARDEREGPDFVLRQERTLAGNRVKKRVTIEWKDGRTRSLEENVRIFSPAELRDLLRAAGFCETRLFGSFQGEPLTQTSARLIALARIAGA